MPDNGELMEKIYLGETIKAIDDNGKVGGYLVRFTSEQDPDLTGEYFTPETDFGEPVKYPVLYHHGQDETIKRRKLGVADVKIDDVGLWAEAQLGLRDEYEKYIFELVKQGKIGWSSGAASHTVETENTGKANWIKQWYIAEASLTPTPAEYRNIVEAMKSLGAGAQVVAVETVENEINHNEDIKMEKYELSKEEVSEMISTATKAAVEEFAEKLPENVKGFDITDVKDPADVEFSTMADELKAIKDFENSRGRKEDPRLKRLKAPLGMNEGTQSEGGFLLEPTIAADFLMPIHEVGVFSRLARRLPVSAKSNFGWINGIDETSRATGSRFGGVQGYWVAEAGSVTATKPKFKRVDWELNKLSVLMYITEEQLEDVAQTSEIARLSAGEELLFLVNDAILNGNGVGKPLGIMNSGSLVSATRLDANKVQHADIIAMWQRLHPRNRANAAWFINSEVEPQLDSLLLSSTVGSVEPRFVNYGPDGVLRIKGKPVYVTEFNQALGTVGDIVLADMSDYLLWEKGAIKSSANPWIQWLTDEEAFKFTYRVDGKPATSSAITPFKGSATQSPYVALSTSS